MDELTASSLILFTTLAFAQPEPAAPTLESFHLVSVHISDLGPAWYYRIFDVQPQGANGTTIQHTLISPLQPGCSRQRIQSKRVVDTHRTPADLVAQSNPCAITASNWDQTIQRYRKANPRFETLRYGIVAKCSGGRQVTLALPASTSLNLEQFAADYPVLAALWELPDKLVPHRDRLDEDDLTLDLQTEGERVLPDFRAGRFDAGLQAAGSSRSFAEILKNYAGPVQQADVDALRHGRLVDATTFRFAHYEPAPYPLAAYSGNLHGRVTLRLNVSNETGEVRDVQVLSGHQFLAPSAEATARKWRFEPGSASPTGRLEVAIDFSRGCE